MPLGRTLPDSEATNALVMEEMVWYPDISTGKFHSVNSFIFLLFFTFSFKMIDKQNWNSQ
ncbi:hypothetical protein E2C01_017735 [Portunus trituberculatus]|uniref:Uncharacterized protein n=1 Tax=Portunus trituberculatus TaxID=210409 RepID=A0A5B7DTB9_PORTR|nr:hypothetical protein [Portunus trituberculatus]